MSATITGTGSASFVPGHLTYGHFDPLAVRADFPILSTVANGRPLAYLDNGATTQKPRQVIDPIERHVAAASASPPPAPASRTAWPPSTACRWTCASPTWARTTWR